MTPALEDHQGGTRMHVRVQPKTSRESISLAADTLRITLTAPPVDGEANAALIALLAKRLHLPKSTLQLIAGEKSRQKTIYVPNKTPAEIAAALNLSLS